MGQSTSDFTRFRVAASSAIKANLVMRPFTIEQPIGPAVSLVGKDFSTITGVTADSYRVGNLTKNGTSAQLYRAFYGQVIACLDVDQYNKKVIEAKYPDLSIPVDKPKDVPPTVPKRKPKPVVGAPTHDDLQKSFKGLMIGEDFLAKANLPATKSNSSTQPSAGKGTDSPSTPSVTTVTTITELSPVLDENSCLRNPIVLSALTEKQVAQQSASFIQINWRSPQAIFRYVGSLMRLRARFIHDNPTKSPEAEGQPWTWSDGSVVHSLFSFTPDGVGGRVSTSYRGGTYAVPDEVLLSDPSHMDHSLQVMSLLSRLLNENKLASDIPVTQRLEIIP